jgi:hypothetical protein
MWSKISLTESTIDRRYHLQCFEMGRLVSITLKQPLFIDTYTINGSMKILKFSTHDINRFKREHMKICDSPKTTSGH